MEDIRQQLNLEIINQVTNSLYAFAYTGEHSPEDVIILKNDLDENRIDVYIDIEENSTGIILNCSFQMIVNPEYLNQKNTANE